MGCVTAPLFYTMKKIENIIVWLIIGIISFMVARTMIRLVLSFFNI